MPLAMIPKIPAEVDASLSLIKLIKHLFQPRQLIVRNYPGKGQVPILMERRYLILG